MIVSLSSVAPMGPTQLAAQDHGKRVASVFEMEEEGFSVFHGSEIPSEHTGKAVLVTSTHCEGMVLTESHTECLLSKS